MRILVVEGDKRVASFLERGLREEGYLVDVAHDESEGLTKASRYDYDLLLVDIMLPGDPGLRIVRDPRAKERAVPMVVLSASQARDHGAIGMNGASGGSAAQPFDFDELMARARELLRRRRTSRPDVLCYDDVELDRLKRSATRGGRRLDLTPKELQLLEWFMLNAERVVSRSELLEKVWDLDFDPLSNVVDVHVGHLRNKLRSGDAPPLLHTVRGAGYVLHRGQPSNPRRRRK